jgi:hypothetical protein
MHQPLWLRGEARGIRQKHAQTSQMRFPTSPKVSPANQFEHHTAKTSSAHLTVSYLELEIMPLRGEPLSAIHQAILDNFSGDNESWRILLHDRLCGTSPKNRLGTAARKRKRVPYAYVFREHISEQSWAQSYDGSRRARCLLIARERLGEPDTLNNEVERTDWMPP